MRFAFARTRDRVLPELPDILLYVSSLERLLLGRKLESVSVRSPSLLRTYKPDVQDCVGQKLSGFSRCGKRVVWHLSNDYFFVFHLMIAGRFHWKEKRVLPKTKNDLAAFRFEHGTMLLTEASPKKRAGLWCLSSLDEVQALGAGGVNVLEEDDEVVREALLRSNNTLKRALADPSRFDGIGNAYSDEILHDARLSPLKRTDQLSIDEVTRLIASTRRVLGLWIVRLQEQAGERFPEKVTAFRPEMAVHGKFAAECPVCAAPVQRIRYANNECNYCPGCQTEGRILADRSLSRLLRDDWPKSLEELEN